MALKDKGWDWEKSPVILWIPFALLLLSALLLGCALNAVHPGH